jgi:hypothetical protein
MAILTTKKLLASAVVFLFTNMAQPMVAAPPEMEAAMAPVQQEAVITQTAPKIDIGIPRVVNLSKGGATGQAVASGHKIIIRSVDYQRTLLDELRPCSFSFNKDSVAVMSSGYSNTQGGYVNLSSSDLRTGLVLIQKAQNVLEHNVGYILAHPDQYHIRGDLVNVQMAPLLVSDSETGSTLLAMESWDFRLVNAPRYNNVAINQMMENAYSTFKAYAEMMHKTAPGQPVVIHTSFWGTNYQNNPRLTTAIQMVAAELAGVDKIIFHIDSTSPQEAQVLFDAQSFVQAQHGKSVSDILLNMLKMTTQYEWAAGVGTTGGPQLMATME